MGGEKQIIIEEVLQVAVQFSITGGGGAGVIPEVSSGVTTVKFNDLGLAGGANHEKALREYKRFRIILPSW